MERTRENAAFLVREKALVAKQLEDEYRVYMHQVTAGMSRANQSRECYDCVKIERFQAGGMVESLWQDAEMGYPGEEGAMAPS